MTQQIVDRVTKEVMGPLRVVRLRVFAVLVAASLAVVGLVSLAAWPVWGAVGAALVAVAFAVKAVTSPLEKPMCWNCGHNLEGVAPGTYGMTCPECGSIHSGLRTAMTEDAPDLGDDDWADSPVSPVPSDHAGRGDRPETRA